MEKNIPKYVELSEWLKRQIDEGQLTPGQKIHSENELKEMFQLSRQTVRHAIETLEKDGILRRVHGSGTYVCDNRPLDMNNRNKVAVITTYVDNYIFPKTIQGIENVLSENDYSIQISFTNNQNQREKTLLKDILEKDEVAGIIIETTKSGLPNPNLHLYRQLQEKKIPVLFINSYYQGLDNPYVSMNDRLVGEKMTKYLIAKGHTKIGGIFKLDDGQGHLRYAGYAKVLSKAGLGPEDSNIVWVDTEDVKHLEHSWEKIKERLQGCTAVLCYNDEIAFALIEMFKKEGIRVPEDISVMGVDDSELAVLGEIGITSVPHPMEKLGEKAAKNLIGMMKNPLFQGKYEFGVEIVERDSVKSFK